MWNNVPGPGIPSGVQRLMPVVAPSAMPVIPPGLDFQDDRALKAVCKALRQAPALQDWLDKDFDGRDADQVRTDLVTLMLHKYADDGHPPGAALELRETVLARLVRHLSPAGKGALQQSLAADVVPTAFAKHLAERDRWSLDGLVCHQDGEACLARGDNAQAAAHFEDAARRFANVPGHETLRADLHRYAGDAHAREHNRTAAADQFITASRLDIEHALMLNAGEQPPPSDAAAAQDALTRAARDLAAAAAFYRALELPTLAIVANTVAASTFVDLGLCPQAAGLLDSIADIWTDIAEMYHQTKQLPLAAAAALEAEQASQNAALAYWVTENYAAAGRTLVKVCDYDTAAVMFKLDGDHGAAGICFLAVGQRHEAVAAAHRGVGQLEQANAAAENALIFYTLACRELAESTEDHVNAPRYAEAAVTAQAHFDALLLSLRAP